MDRPPGPIDGAERLRRLAEAVEHNQRAYREALRSPNAPRWDYCILTARTEGQASVFRTELSEREERGVFPAATRVRVYADPQGRRVGTGGATLHVLREIARELASIGDGGGGVERPEHLFAGLRVLLIHAGGDSRRLPHSAALGKVFAMLPTTLADGSVATLFDILFLGLAGLPSQFDSGLVLSSGDVALTFDPREIDWALPGVVGVSMSVDAIEATGHGVYVADRGCPDVRAYLQKPTLEELRAADGLIEDGRAHVDTGLLKLDRLGLEALLEMAGVGVEPGGPAISARPLGAESVADLRVDLYRDILPALPPEATRERYMRDVGPPAEGGYDARDAIWCALRERRDVPFHVQCAEPALFTHIGNTRQYLATVTTRSEFGRLHGFSGTLDSYVAGRGDECVVEEGACLHETIITAPGTVGAGSLVQGCHLGAPFRIGAGSIVGGVDSERAELVVPEGVVACALPVRYAEDGVLAQPREVTLVFGVDDNPKEARFLGEALGGWLERRGVPSEAIWPEEGPGERSLWTARLHPIGRRGRSWQLAGWLCGASDADARGREAWLSAPRISMAEALETVDLAAMRERRGERLALLECLRFEEAARSDVDARVLFGRVRGTPLAKAVLKHLLTLAGGSEDLLHRARLLKMAADLVEDSAAIGIDLVEEAEADAPGDVADRLVEQAFACIHEAIGSQLPRAARRPGIRVRRGQWVRASCPVRADFAGGWSDTPPHSLERPGTVLNVAVNLLGEPPLRAWGRRLAEPVLRLTSVDGDFAAEIREMQELADCDDPARPLGLHKAAFVAWEIVPEGARGSLQDRLRELGGGFELVTESRVPRGSGVGASSILAAATLGCLARLTEAEPDEQTIFTRVLYLEQLLSAGGGWQDQVGGVVGGAKLIRSDPRDPLALEVERLPLAPEVIRALEERCVLLDTGQKRLARNILRTVMGRYLSRDSRIVHSVREMQRIAVSMRDALLTGDLDEVGWQMWMHWELQKILDPHCTTPWIDELLADVEPHVVGAKAAGAGGGGFVLLIAKADCVDSLRQRLSQLTAGTGARVYDFEMSHGGLQVGPCDDGPDTAFERGRRTR